ncbi:MULTISPECIES: methyltransferase [Vibrio]|uniref:methyltransferase n=1 Tax=Vibrio TaxID=662 RepID=UPI001EEAACF5|nr:MULTISPECIES: methyltransferase [Vibrio]MCG6321379.1 SAM-dependent methyltransferase [Vibrio alginolyticus]MDW1924433.1 methyltransferase [Vibrio sp. 947]MDW1947175.1 methyltransferase [Vibrio sp. 812(2023)]MDW1990305.1 methyltransferase [Vibrio sp. 780]MDW2184363.1 methyltransferase [Vibrio sp. 1733]
MKTQFQFINDCLIENQSLWRFEPFKSSIHASLPWQEQHPQLCQWLASLSPSQIEEYKAEPELALKALSPFLPELEQLSELTGLEPLALKGLELVRGLDNGIPGRKLEQISSMGEAAIQLHHGDEWLEWCSGKGYLGRILTTQTEQPVTSFEYQQALCDSGQQAANEHHWKMRFIQGDAFDSKAKAVFKPTQHAVALHACGDLHVRLMQYGSEKGVAAMTISPCCYHLIQSEQYQPMSVQGRASSLSLSKQELRIPLQQTVTGGERVRRHRQQEMVFRLGFDLITRQVLGMAEYQPVPSIRKSQLSDGFESLCRWAAEQKGIALSQEIDFDHFEKLSEQRFWQMERLSLVQLVFQRPLEIWLALDKALYLEERGYRVRLAEFCAKSVTPRNILICAYKI